MTMIEQILHDYLSSAGKTAVDRHHAQLEEKPNACMNCGLALSESENFCDDDCKDAWWGIDKMQIERERIAGQREDAEENRRELARENADRLRDEAIELMVRETTVEPDEDRLTDEARELCIRNTELQDNTSSGAVKSE